MRCFKLNEIATELRNWNWFLAYEILSDKNKRAKYDRFGDDAFKNGGGFQEHSFDFDDFFKHFDDSKYGTYFLMGLGWWD